MNRLEQLRVELQGLVAAREGAMKGVESLQIDIENVREEIRLELEHNYCL